MPDPAQPGSTKTKARLVQAFSFPSCAAVARRYDGPNIVTLPYKYGGNIKWFLGGNPMIQQGE
ncbi:MAG: hypothetical protein ACK4GK_12040, partial [Ferrovibrio sp.]